MARVDHKRRSILQGIAGVAALSAPTIALAQSDVIDIGVLTPLTGAGGSEGPLMLAAMQAVADDINDAGGILKRPIKLHVQDGQTNPEAAVRAARKLIDVDRVAAILGTWASGVTSAVAPLCWENKVMLMCCSGADSITKLPHEGYIIRTEPMNNLGARKIAQLTPEIGAKRVYVMSVQAPFAAPTQAGLRKALPDHGVEVVGTLIYERDMTAYRSEVNMALKARPDLIFLNGYRPDVMVLIRELYRAGYDGARLALAYAVDEKVVNALTHDLTDGIYVAGATGAIGSPSYEAATERLKMQTLNSHVAQAYDWMSMTALAIEKTGSATGPAIRDGIRMISQGQGTKVYSAVEGLRLLREGTDINYEGASGPCIFDKIGDITDCSYRLQQIKQGIFNTVKVV